MSITLSHTRLPGKILNGTVRQVWVGHGKFPILSQCLRSVRRLCTYKCQGSSFL